MALLEIDDLHVEFALQGATLHAVEGVSMRLDEGEVLGIVGESGSGKSVAMLALMGLVGFPGRVRAQRLQFAGHDLLHLGAAQRRALTGRDVAMIFQDPGASLNPSFTVGFQIGEVLRLHLGLDRRAAVKRSIELLEQVGIPAAASRLNAFPHQLSGGMNQRVMIAMAIACNPRLLIADEPTTALDVSVQAQIITLLKRICRDHGTAVMLITHDMGVIAETCDRVAVMYAGRIVELGPVRDVIHHSAHPYTLGLMGSIPAMDVERERLLQIDGSMPRLDAIPTGCAFHPRCPQAFERCRRERPELRPAVATEAACWLHQDGGRNG